MAGISNRFKKNDRIDKIPLIRFILCNSFKIINETFSNYEFRILKRKEGNHAIQLTVFKKDKCIFVFADPRICFFPT